MKNNQTFNAKKIERATTNLNNTKAVVVAIRDTINEKIAKGEDYANDIATLKTKQEKYTNAQIMSSYYGILYGNHDEAPIITLVKNHKWAKTELKPQKDATGRITGYQFPKNPTEVFHDLLFFAERYGEDMDNVAGLNDINALDALHDLYITIQAAQAVRYNQTIKTNSIREEYEAFLKAENKQGLKNPVSKTSIGKAIIKACEAFIGVTPKVTQKIHSEGDDKKDKTLINFLLDSMIRINGKTMDVHFVGEEVFAKHFLHVMHCVIMDVEIQTKYDDTQKSDIKYEEAEVDDAEIQTEAKPAEDKADKKTK